MSNQAIQSGDSIIATIVFDELSKHVLKCAFEFANHGKLKVIAIHVVELMPVQHNFLAESITGINLAKAARDLQNENMEIARDKLSKLAKEIDPNGDLITSKVLSGSPAQMIAAEAAATNAAFIFTGVASVSHRFTPKGLSAALTLMSSASVPVIAIKLETIFESFQKDFRVLIADDMRDSGKEALRKALSLACLFPSSDVFHVHVNNSLTEAVLESAIKVEQAQGSSKTESAAKIYEHLTREIGEQLEKRAFEAMKGLPSPGLNYYPQVRSGSVSENLDLLIAEYNPNLIVFGRHQTFRTKPFSIGQMPFYSMLSNSVAIMIVPEQ